MWMEQYLHELLEAKIAKVNHVHAERNTKVGWGQFSFVLHA